MTVGNERLLKIAKALDAIVEIGEDIFADGKVDFSDAMHAPRLATPAKDLYEAFKEIKELGEEVKDLDWNELGEIISELNN